MIIWKYVTMWKKKVDEASGKKSYKGTAGMERLCKKKDRQTDIKSGMWEERNRRQETERSLTEAARGWTREQESKH